MLQQSTNSPPIVGYQKVQTDDRKKIIDADVQPLGIEPASALVCEIDHLVEIGDIFALCALYDCYIAAAQAMGSISNQPRADVCADFIEDERNRLISKAYLVADRMQHMHPQRYEHNEFCRVLFDCAMLMGSDASEAITVIQARPKPPLQVSLA